MEELHLLTINKAYEAFNKRKIEQVISLMHPDVLWPNGWEGGYVKRAKEVTEYWQRQWKEINPHVEPISIKQNEDGKIEAEVHQVVKTLEGELLMDKIVKHIYTIEDGLIRSMEIEEW